MNILIPMAGAGQRFVDEGYRVHKPTIPTYDRRTGKKIPMVICATMDLPGVLEDGSNVIYVDRDFHKRDGVENEIKKYYEGAKFITVDHLTEGQACTCLLAKEQVNTEEALLIAGCDNGMIMKEDRFAHLCTESDVLVFTYRNNEAVTNNPNAYGWMKIDEDDNIVGLSIKKAISDHPEKDHAVVATFWFRKGSIFVEAAEKMIAENDRINNEFYVDQVVKHVLELGYKAKVFEIDRYIAWGTPADYETYQKTYDYWKGFLTSEKIS